MIVMVIVILGKSQYRNTRATLSKQAYTTNSIQEGWLYSEATFNVPCPRHSV